MIDRTADRMRAGVLTLMGVGLGVGVIFAAGCAEDTEAAGTPVKEKLPISVVNRTGGPLDGVGMKAGKWSVSWGDVAVGASETISLPEGERPQTAYFTWRDAKGERHYQNLTLGIANIRSATITIDSRQQAGVTFR